MKQTFNLRIEVSQFCHFYFTRVSLVDRQREAVIINELTIVWKGWQKRVDNAAGTIMPLMMQTDRCHRMIIEGQVHRLGVHRTQHMILMCLSHCDTPPAQSEIAEMFQVSHAAVAVSLRKMEQAGLIVRTAREGNARVKEIRLTEKGVCMVEKTKKLFEAVGNAALKGIPEEDLDVMHACMEKIKKNLEEFRSDDEKELSEKEGRAEAVEEMV